MAPPAAGISHANAGGGVLVCVWLHACVTVRGVGDNGLGVGGHRIQGRVGREGGCPWQKQCQVLWWVGA